MGGIMSFIDFVNLIQNKTFFQVNKYMGEDLHMLRDGSEFNISTYFKDFNGLNGVLFSFNTSVNTTLDNTDPNNPLQKVNNISLNQATGIIKANAVSPTPSTPSDIVRNLVVITTLGVKYYDENNVQQSVAIPVSIRVHFHESVTKIWLTPSPQTIYKDASSYARFHIYALFDDGMTGDVSCSSDSWSYSGTDVSVDADGKVTLVNPVNVTTGLKANVVSTTYLGATASGSIIVADTISSLGNPLSCTLLSGPGLANRDNCTNLIILSDGFEQNSNPTFDETTAFNSLIDQIVSNTRFSGLSPWNVLLDKINVWKCYIPTIPNATVDANVPNTEKSASISFNCEIVPLVYSASPTIMYQGFPLSKYIATADSYLSLSGYPLNFILNSSIITHFNTLVSAANPLITPPSNSPVPATPIITLSQLISVVGFPTASDVDISKTDKIAKWTSFFNTTASGFSLNNVTDSLFTFWRLLALRAFLDKRDTPFAVTQGYKPMVNNYRDTDIDIDPYRRNRANLNAVVANAKDVKSNTTIGYLWNKTTSGKDANNIVIFSRTPLTHVADTHLNPDGFYMVIGSYDGGLQNTVVYGVSNNVYKPIFPASDPTYNISAQENFLHECGHLLGMLGDEYGGPNIATDNTKYSLKQTFETDNPLHNIQLKDDIYTVSSWQGDNIKWRWLRYSAAFNIPIPITGTNPYVIAFASPSDLEKAQLSVNDIVYLRQRKLSVVNVSNQLPSPLYSCSFKISVIDYKNLTVTVQKVNAGDSFNTSDYPVGSIVVKLVTDPFDNTKYAELISSVVRNYITSSAHPLNSVIPSNTNDIQYPNVDVVIDNPMTSFPSDSSRIGGLYYQGYANNDSYLHPFGFCLMRGDVAAESSNNITIVDNNFMCPVCKYILTEKIYPGLHWLIDAQYSSIYPQKK